MDDFSFLKARLHGLGLRLTPQREAVWRYFAGVDRGRALSEAAGALAAESTSPATVYRAVKTLSSLGLLRPRAGEDGEVRYVAVRPGHVHLLRCTGCDRAVEFHECGLDVLEKLVEAKSGFSVQGHHLELYGRCPDCAPFDKISQ
ncbi:MAG: transcriptional repressor [Desulfovibrionaceae bacterium]|nr:transcriptional repressor [Desulfovibrionaceae bacterium]MBF0512538.1 transcriptional repressor [Desulfovibrionaceae bacterium]